MWDWESNERKFHLDSWEQLALPKYMRGSGIKNLTSFNTALCLKSMWRCIFDKGLWSFVMKTKYLRRIFVNSWFILSEIDQKFVSIIWNNFLKVFHRLKMGIHWDIGDGKNVYIGVDPFIGYNMIFLYYISTF